MMLVGVVGSSLGARGPNLPAPLPASRYGKYDPDGEAETGKRPSRKARKSDDAFSDSYFDIMDRAHDLQLVRLLASPACGRSGPARCAPCTRHL